MSASNMSEAQRAALVSIADAPSSGEVTPVAGDSLVRMGVAARTGNLAAPWRLTPLGVDVLPWMRVHVALDRIPTAIVRTNARAIVDAAPDRETAIRRYMETVREVVALRGLVRAANGHTSAPQTTDVRALLEVERALHSLELSNPKGSADAAQ